MSNRQGRIHTYIYIMVNFDSKDSTRFNEKICTDTIKWLEGILGCTCWLLWITLYCKRFFNSVSYIRCPVCVSILFLKVYLIYQSIQNYYIHTIIQSYNHTFIQPYIHTTIQPYIHTYIESINQLIKKKTFDSSVSCWMGPVYCKGVFMLFIQSRFKCGHVQKTSNKQTLHIL